MKVPLSWLKEYVAIDLPADELAERLALTGTEVERVSRFGVPAGDGNLDRFVIGQVKKRAAHPNADKLSLCEVDVGGKLEQIVCGASNFSEGDKTAVCLPGGMLPDGRRLESAVIRGIESHGMMCSEAELGLSGESAGIMILPEDAPVGEKLAEFISISDEVLELEVTPNRPDCLSVYGVAREVAAVTGSVLAPEPANDAQPRGDDRIDELVKISVADSGLCPRYGARIIAGVKIGPSPPWLKARIAAAGMRPVNNVVDITNFVMWTLGEPMHAFDLNAIAGRKLTARRAGKGEKITTIDGDSRVLNDSMLVIADEKKPVAIAGVMGGESSEVTESTTDILLEAANFDGPSVMSTEMALGLRSESSTRFEKGLDPELVPRALAMASGMMVKLCGGRLVPGQIDIYAQPRQEVALHLRAEKVTGLLGIEVPEPEMVSILESLGFGCRHEGGAIHVTVPSFRADVEREVDLIEEVARIFGLELIPPTLPGDMRVMGGLSDYQSAERDIVRALAATGMNEVITYTFISPDFADRFRLDDKDPRRDCVRLANPLSIDQSVMRTLLLPSLLGTISTNLSLRNADVNIFEVGRAYLRAKGKEVADERRTVGGCLCGSLRGETWTGDAGQAVFHTGKGIVEAAFESVKGHFTVEGCDEPFLHPGKSAFIMVDGRRAGFVGEVHPLVLEAFDIDRPVVAFEVLEDALIASSAGIIIFEDLITYPGSFQDLAVVVDEKIPSQDVIDVVVAAGAPLLRSAHVFDVYAGDQVGDGKKSIALSLEFRSPERTLTDEDVDAARSSIVSALADRLSASLRE